MITLIGVLIFIGILGYVVSHIPMLPWIRNIVMALIVLIAVAYLFRFFGVLLPYRLR